MLYKVAVITRTKNRTLLLERAIDSVLNQRFDDWIHIIINDGGDPYAVEELLLRKNTVYKNRYKIIHNKISEGMEAASNIGISNCDSQYILIHDDDDSLSPDFLSKTIAYLENINSSSIKGVCSWVNQINEKITEDGIVHINTSIFREINGCLGLTECTDSNPIPPISFLFDRAAYNSVGGFDESLPVLGDWDFLLRFITNYDIGIIPERLANYHIRPNAHGLAANSINSNLSNFIFHEKLIRNKFARRYAGTAFSSLIFEGGKAQKLRRLYNHPVIGRLIKFWSKYINHNIPHSPE